MIWIRNLTMTNLRVIHSARSRIKIPSEDVKVLYWSACYGLALAATTLQAGVNILQIKSWGGGRIFRKSHSLKENSVLVFSKHPLSQLSMLL